jgi:hypothetical protein
MKIHAVVFRHKDYPVETPHNVIFGRSARWAGHERKVLRQNGWKIVRTDAHDVPKVKGGLIMWLNAHIKIID